MMCFLSKFEQTYRFMSYELKGKIHKIFDTAQVTDTFRKREFVIESQDGMYSQFVKLQLLQDKCDLIESFNVGDEVVAFFNLTGKEYQKGNDTLYFTNLNAWRIVSEAPQEQATSQVSSGGADEGYFPSADAESTAPKSNDEYEDDLPF